MRDWAELVSMTPVLDRPALVGVDGVDGSGKTTFAGALGSAYREAGRAVVVVHLDDFLNPRAVRHRQGRDSPVGFFEDTYDLTAFRAAVLTPVRNRVPALVTRRVFDHRRDAPVSEAAVEIAATGVVLVEGMFLHRDELRHEWDLSIFLDVPLSVSVGRMAARDGADPDPEHVSNRRYVEGQRLYFARCTPRQRATIVLDNS